MADLLLTDVRTDAGTTVAVTVVDGRIAAVGDAPASWDGPRVDGGGRLVLPGLVDGHAHVDKTMWGLPWRPHSAGPGLDGLVRNEREGRRSLPPVEERVGALLDAYVERGTTLLRTHVDVDVDQGIAAVEGTLAAASARRDRIDVEVVAFPQSGMLVAPGTADLMDAAVRAGAHVVGGIDPAGFDGDAVAHLDTIFAVAERHGVGVDLHLHDRGSLGRWEVGLVVERTRALSMAGRVTVSHAFCLCDGDPAVAPLLEEVADAGISLATVAPGEVAPLPFDVIDALGIPVVLGQDGIRDLWSPWGDADMLARAGLLSWRSGHRADHDIARSVARATSDGAVALGVTDHVLAPGGRGDLVLVDAAGAAEAAVAHPPRALVVKGGRPVAGPLAASGRTPPTS